jgi:hypothetical protein
LRALWHNLLRAYKKAPLKATSRIIAAKSA